MSNELAELAQGRWKAILLPEARSGMTCSSDGEVAQLSCGNIPCPSTSLAFHHEKKRRQYFNLNAVSTVDIAQINMESFKGVLALSYQNMRKYLNIQKTPNNLLY